MGSLQRRQESSAFPDEGKSGAGRPNVQVAKDAVGKSGATQDADTSCETNGVRPVYLSGVVELLDGNSDDHAGDGAVAAPRGGAAESEEFPMLEYMDSNFQRIDERVSKSQGSGQT